MPDKGGKNDREPLLFRWRKAILASDLPPTTRHILLTLSVHADVDGSRMFPSTETLALETGFRQKTICTHLERADAAGWVERRTAGSSRGRGWRRYIYRPMIPDAESDGPPGSQESPRSDASLDGASENADDGTSKPTPAEDMRADELVAAWIELRGARPPDAAIRKQGAVAKRLVRDFTRSELEGALQGIGNLFPHSDGEPWDLFDLEKKIVKALDATSGNGRQSSKYSDPAEEEDYEALAREFHGRS